MDLYDVIIVGAGPAGLKCAEVLGGSPLRVLLLEKNEKIGPKICAGGLTGKDVAYLNLPEELIEFRHNKIHLHVQGFKSTVKADYDFAFSIDREKLGQWQLKKLSPFKNVEVRTKARVSAITENHVTVNGETIAYKYLVGADGSNSLVKRFAGLKTPAQGVGIQYIIPTDKYSDFEFFFIPKYFSAWYSWIFPHRGYVSIGCGCTPEILSLKKLHRNFHTWLKKNKIDVSAGKYEVFPMNCDYYGSHFGNVFLTGDAAGLLSSFTGEGIYQALISGEEAAKTILDPTYESKKMPEIIRKHNRHRQLIDLLIRWGRWKSLLFLGGMLLFKIPKYKQRAIAQFG
ncbi:MAG: NAD(P)/FAD-dependent oxidoreductase [Dysgonamonadaceae bacterium]|jgi:geranylgeranyl reductase|nr:NAD(P)/FAD-dependent oxidoreductase [Dysgonamonadaceae bacterium]